MKLYEIDPGVWIVPELVSAVTCRGAYNGMTYDGYLIECWMVGGGVVVVRRRSWRFDEPERPSVYTAQEWEAYGMSEAREVVAWIDERRTEPLEVVRA